MAVQMKMTAGRMAAAADQLPVWVEAAELAEHVCELTAAFPPEDRDWLSDPLCHAARSGAERIALGWQQRRQPAVLIEHLSVAEADLHEMQTWALLGVRHHHWSHEVADDVDRRCEAVLDTLAEMIHDAARWCEPAAAPCRHAA